MFYVFEKIKMATVSP